MTALTTKRQTAAALSSAPDGVCTAPPGGCGMGRRIVKRPAQVGTDGTLWCQCGSEMRRAKRRSA